MEAITYSTKKDRPTTQQDGQNDTNNIALTREYYSTVDHDLASVLTVIPEDRRDPVREVAARINQKEWPSLKDTNFSPLPRFPLHTLPAVLRDHAKQVGECYQVDVSYPAIAALTVAGFSMGNRTYAHLKKGLRVRPNLYMMVGMASGERKSSGFEPMVEVLHQFARDNQEESERFASQRRIFKHQVDEYEKAIVRQKDPDEQHKFKYELSQLQEPQGISKNFIAENATEEALLQKMAECGEKAAVFSADARDVLDVICGKYNRGQNSESLYLKAFDGDSISNDRMNKGNIFLKSPSLSLLLCVQLDKLKEIGANSGLKDSGFLPRINFIIPESQVGTRFWREDTEIDPEIENDYSEAISRRLSKYCDQTEDDIIQLDDDAKNLWVAWYDDIEAKLTGEYADHASTAIRWQSLPVRLACIISEYSEHPSITKADMESAIEICKYLISHANRARQTMSRGLNNNETRAVKHILGKKLHQFTPKQLCDATRFNADQAQEVLARLEDTGHVRNTGKVKGRIDAPIYEANPEIWKS